MDETKSVSVIEPIGEAMNWMQDRLFDPFDLGEWFVFGFAWFLASLAQFGGSSFNGGGGGGGDGGGGTPVGGSPDGLQEVLSSLTPTIIAVIMVGILVVFGLLALFTWLGSRGSFIFLDSTLRENAAIKEPWSEYSELGNSLFVVRLMYIVTVGLIMLVLVGGGGLAVYMLLTSGDVTGGKIALAVILGLLLLLIFLVFSVVYQMFDDFVVQVMYRRDIYCWEACKLFWNEILSRYPGTFLLFYLMKMLLTLGAGIIMVIGGCLTCCIGFLPYLKNVIFLPIGVFFRTYSIRMLEQFGDEWALEVQDEQVAELF